MNLPTLAISLLALFVALGGSVYAAANINGRAIRVRSLPGNRIKLHSIAANRLKRGVLRRGGGGTGLLTGADINELTLGQVPEAANAETADNAAHAAEAQTALNAVNAINAETVNGHHAGCLPGTQAFAGACWQSTPQGPATAPAAAVDCAAEGGTLPKALELAAFAGLPGVNLDPGDEWAADIVNFTAENAYAVATISSDSDVRSAVYNAGGASAERHYRCVIPLVT